MLSFFKKSLRNKLLTIFIGMGLLPFVTLLIYTLFLTKTKIVNSIVVEQLERTKVVASLMENHLNSLSKEVRFLASLDLMDDLLADDIDRRVSRLLIQKYNDLDLDISFQILSPSSVIIASSDKKIVKSSYNIKDFPLEYGTKIEDKKLFIYSKIYASFDKNKELGLLVLRYSLENLKSYLTHQNSVNSYIMNPKQNLAIGKDLSLNIDFSNKSNSFIDNEHVIVYENLAPLLKEWYIVYAVDKSVALEFVYDFIKFMLYMSVVIIILIIYISLKYSRDIIKPIEDLTAITEDIITTQNYSTKLEVTTQDEIATLTHSFNRMLETTSSALNDLEEENRLRLQRFTQLIDVFNGIIQTKTESECMNISIQEIKKLTDRENLAFVEDKNLLQNGKYLELYVTDFEKDIPIYFGSISLDIERFKDKYEKDFYSSITSMIMLQLDRIRLIQRTMSASNAKSAFISNMSHELRTPLNAIIGFSQFMITYEELSEDQLDTVGNIESSAQYLLSMINEILDIAKIEAGKMEAQMQEVDVLELLNGSYNMLSPLASDKNLEFDFIYDNYKDTKYLLDPKMFQQIILNLLSNSIKFTEKGSVKLELSNDEQFLKVTVKDTGVGIDKEDLKGLFNDFTQIENVMQKKHKGTGLGLSLSRKMAHILGAEIELQSDGLGFGTMTTFALKDNR